MKKFLWFAFFIPFFVNAQQHVVIDLSNPHATIFTHLYFDFLNSRKVITQNFSQLSTCLRQNDGAIANFSLDENFCDLN